MTSYIQTLDELEALIKSLAKTNHDECEDGFYSCPAHTSYFGNDTSKECNCGLEENNKTVSKALDVLKRLR